MERKKKTIENRKHCDNLIGSSAVKDTVFAQPLQLINGGGVWGGVGGGDGAGLVLKKSTKLSQLV
jgi:hypothetical protein